MVDLHSNPGSCCFLDCLARWNSPGRTLVLVNFGLFGQNILHLEKVGRTFLCDVFYLLICQHSQVSGMCNSSQSEDHGAFQVSSWKIRSHFSLRNLSLNLAKICKLCDFSLTYGANCTFLITIQCQYLRRQLFLKRYSTESIHYVLFDSFYFLSLDISTLGTRDKRFGPPGSLAKRVQFAKQIQEMTEDLCWHCLLINRLKLSLKNSK